MTSPSDTTAPLAGNAEQVPDERRGRWAAMVALFLPLVGGLLLAAFFAVTVVGPRLSVAAKAERLVGDAPRAMRTFAEEQADLSGRLASAGTTVEPAAADLLVAAPKRAEPVAVVRAAGVRTAARTRAARRTPVRRVSDPAPTADPGTDGASPPPVTEEPQQPSVEEWWGPAEGGYSGWPFSGQVNPAGGMR